MSNVDKPTELDRLHNAACDSYFRHFGERAIEAAEADWIGQAIDLLRRVGYEDRCSCSPSRVCNTCMASLLLAMTEKPNAQ